MSGVGLHTRIMKDTIDRDKGESDSDPGGRIKSETRLPVASRQHVVNNSSGFIASTETVFLLSNCISWSSIHEIIKTSERSHLWNLPNDHQE